MKNLIIVFLLLHSLACFSQDAEAINSKIHDKLISGRLRLDNFLDSAGFYAFAIRLDVKVKKGQGLVDRISVNDSVAYRLYKDFNFLKAINYRSLLGSKKKATIIIPVGIIIAYPKNINLQSAKIDAESLMQKLFNMYNVNYPVPENVINQYIFLNPFVCTCGLKVYD